MSYWTDMPRISTEFAYRGTDAALMENEALRVTVLPGKGGDILELRDKAADVDVLWHAPHEWRTPGEGYVPAGPADTWSAYYPGGWQVNVPMAGWGGEVSGVPYDLHGESALTPFEATAVEDGGDAVTLRLAAELTYYPFAIERELTLPAGEPALHVSETITNEGGRALEYVWQHHIALGPPLLGPDARLDVPAETGIVESSYDDPQFDTARLAGGETFEWPHAPAADGGTVDLREFPPLDAELHDQVYATDLREGWYGVTNPELDLGVGVSFPTDPFECLWYWQAFGGMEGTPFFERNYNAGLEPTSAYPAGNIPDAQRANGTMKTLAPGDSASVEVTAVTYRGRESIDGVDPDGSVR